MRDDNLWDDTHGVDDLADVAPAQRRGRKTPVAEDTSRHIGCPLWWLKAVLPVMCGKNELVVALFLYRLRSIHRSRTVLVSNARLLAELGIDRYAKYRAIKHLEGAGLITVQRRDRKTLKITFRKHRKV
jgi:hypothetical protein